jgi:hypothetical protein
MEILNYAVDVFLCFQYFCFMKCYCSVINIVNIFKNKDSVTLIVYIHTYHSHFTPEGVAEADTHLLISRSGQNKRIAPFLFLRDGVHGFKEYTYVLLTFYPRRGSRSITAIPPRRPLFSKTTILQTENEEYCRPDRW